MCTIKQGRIRTNTVRVRNKICSCHDIAEILLMLALNTNQSINHVRFRVKIMYSSVSTCELFQYTAHIKVQQSMFIKIQASL